MLFMVWILISPRWPANMFSFCVLHVQGQPAAQSQPAQMADLQQQV